ncbi:unnamed protein product [Cyprideis torosa]|uniref:Uncharacterized protein n=1 Tax=Cyprideis torosa TaxID=163714 RepID=A0A7R8ZQ55_9CRUS|nr:unnamed protein product [Cyprideis torosa]CAG0895525.1 unnamed protein product [Cyprideis torosa]
MENPLVRPKPGSSESDNCSTRSRSLDRSVSYLARTVTGIVLWFNRRKGFGFIRRKDTPQEVFVHKSAIVKGPPHLSEGETVQFDILPGPEGKSDEARNVTGPNGRRVRGAKQPPFRFYNEDSFFPPPRAAGMRFNAPGRYMRPWVFCPCAYFVGNGLRNPGSKRIPTPVNGGGDREAQPAACTCFPAPELVRGNGGRLRAGRSGPRVRRGRPAVPPTEVADGGTS